MARPSPTVQVMLDAARLAGKALLHDFAESEALQVSYKGPGDVVSSADLRAENIIHGKLMKMRPGYGFLMEESGEIQGSDSTHRFVVDPLDGTLNFLHGLPHFAVSIGLERDRKLVAGVVHDVVRNEMFWAENGRGAWCGNRRLRVSGRRMMSKAVLATGRPKRDEQNRPCDDMRLVTIAGLRRLGAAALDLAYVAAGRLDGFWARTLKPWDIAAGAVLVREAGGYVGGIDGEDFMCSGDVIAANRILSQKIADLLDRPLPPCG